MPGAGPLDKLVEQTATAKTTASSLQGKARMGYPVDSQDIRRISVDAHSTFAQGDKPLQPWGTFRIYHKVEHTGGEPEVYWGDFKVDCLTTGGPTATVTGTLERTSPGHPWQTKLEPHVRMGAPRLAVLRDTSPRAPGRLGTLLPSASLAAGHSPTGPSAHAQPTAGDRLSRRLPIVTAPADRVPHCAEDPEDRADDQQDDAYGPQDRYSGQEPDDEENDSEDDHGVLRCDGYPLLSTIFPGRFPRQSLRLRLPLLRSA
ncbi:hypothetical protein GCM10010324_67320 [Streptomyces hiroshimensis]|uniref:Uncharacterized protein n=1 Tax=Streptomyces hiroshimensis TaxID=66424 RepID=A0ABQ2ZEQ9_9ACTN|nr:hypothetical protein GCM10010324_67320 [Streptomyces hiroshimensis]